MGYKINFKIVTFWELRHFCHLLLSRKNEVTIVNFLLHSEHTHICNLQFIVLNFSNLLNNYDRRIKTLCILQNFNVLNIYLIFLFATHGNYYCVDHMVSKKKVTKETVKGNFTAKVNATLSVIILSSFSTPNF